MNSHTLNRNCSIYCSIQGRHFEQFLDSTECRKSETTPQKSHAHKTIFLVLCVFIRLLQAWPWFLAHPG